MTFVPRLAPNPGYAAVANPHTKFGPAELNMNRIRHATTTVWSDDGRLRFTGGAVSVVIYTVADPRFGKRVRQGVWG